MIENIHIARWGDAGSRVVLIHGGAQGTASAGHKNFFAQESLGREGWRLLVPDRPGHGQSPDPGRGDDPEADGIWVADLLEDGAHLVGHSFGGLVALAAAARRPEAVRSLTLIEPALHKVSIASPAVRRVVFGLATTMLLPFSPATRSKRAMKLLGIPEAFNASEADMTSMGKALKRARFPSKEKMAHWLAEMHSARIPVLAIAGTASPSFQAIVEIAAAKAGGHSLVVPSEHHFPQWAGASFNNILADFWTRAEADPAALISTPPS